MLVHGDFDLNCVQRGTQSLKQVLKQKILNQEALFRNQVHELHRLYEIQKALMQDTGYTEFDRHYFYNARGRSSIVPLTPPKNYESFEKEARFSSMSKVGSAQFTGEELVERQHGACEMIQWRSIDQQIPANDFISCVDKNLPKNYNCWDNSSKILEFKHPHFDGNGLDPESLELSLRLGDENRRKWSAMRTLFDKKTYSGPQNFIDLEEPTEMISNGNKKHATSPGCTAPTPFLVAKLESKFSVVSDPTISKSVAKDLAPEIGEISSMVDDCEYFHDRNSVNKAFKGHHKDILWEGLFNKKQDFTSGKAGHVDLSKVQLDHLSCYSNDPVVEYESSVVVRENDAVNLALMDSSSDIIREKIWERKSKSIEKVDSEMCLSGSNSTVLRHSIGPCENLDHQCGEDKNEEVGLKSELQKCAVTGQAGCENSYVEANEALGGSHQNQNTFQDGHGDKSYASCKSIRISDNDSSSETRKSEVLAVSSKFSGFNQYSGTDLGSQVIETTASDHDRRSSNSGDMKHKSCDNKDSAEVDCLIEIAAQSLLQISLDNSSYLDPRKQAGSNEMENNKEELPQCSSDSYELMVLQLTESTVDDDSVSSKLFEVNEKETRDFSMKLRRGRRMKDFQKEILPGLASLSRHEIREDINIMEAVLRSREYRKMRAKTADKRDWCTPVRSKRSRLNYAGRRNIS
ncbi:hypothetical protein HS088_TW15G00384 [Tripterygium wilfordii]|uniref:Uncharacterized protein n=1 Tax=Tripterygium wilfordii TaxID=458696 RepID=A0A7J7CLC5_TRIWF|nr:uncharacterized protein LOC119980099 [Tripterygium wilfordii]XP_038678687.1 uncharacterized protein LOC119980099 [Tripterygium wilfordii]KAF5734887.1 hypothetical protein HS088_TW15G00384 [Tripterygium wilfordii]